MSLQSINLANSPRDALLLAFHEAKFSIVEYDPETHDLKTLSLHYFEEDDMKVFFLIVLVANSNNVFFYCITKLYGKLCLLGWLDSSLSCSNC